MTSTTPSVLSDPDIPAAIAQTLADPACYATDAIHDAYRWLRANNPVGRARPEGFTPFWVITRHADILEVSRRNDLFPYGDRSSTLTDAASEARVREITGGSPSMVRSLVQMDDPEHLKHRALTQAWFMPQSVRKREVDIAAIAERTVERFAATGGRCDFVRDVALGYPLHVVMDILGVPEQDEPRMLRLTQELFGPTDPDTARAAAQLSAAQYAEAVRAVVDDFKAYFAAIIADRRANPRDDLASVIANAQLDGRPLAETETTSYFMIVATAGHDTTSSSIATGMWALATIPGLLARLKADPALLGGFIDESIRWASPVKTFMRTASMDTEIGGRPIAKGDWLMLCYASGNRDEAVFEAPYAFQIDRAPNRHLAFGFGTHLCLGQALAKLEMKMLWERLIPRLASVSLDGDPRWAQSWFVNGLKSLPVRFELDR